MLYSQGTGAGSVLTIDEHIQRICEGVAQQMMNKGSIVVLETATGRVRASVSMPVYDPEMWPQALQRTTPLSSIAPSVLSTWVRCSSRFWPPRRWKQVLIRMQYMSAPVPRRSVDMFIAVPTEKGMAR